MKKNVSIPKRAMRKILSLVLKVRVVGQQHIDQASSQPCIIIANHSSLLDVLLIDLFIDCDKTFCLNNISATPTWARMLLLSTKYRQFDPDDEQSVRKATHIPGTIVLFPENKVSTSGELLNIHSGCAALVYQKKAPVLPLYIHGAGRSRLFGFQRGKAQLLPPITLCADKVQTLKIPAARTKKDKVRITAHQLYALLEDAGFACLFKRESIFCAFLNAVSFYGRKYPIIQDGQSPRPLTYGRVLLGSLILGKKLRLLNEQTLAFFLPNSVATAVSFLGAQAYGIQTAMLNISADLPSLQKALHTAQIKHIITSKRFITLAKLEHIIIGLSEHVQVTYLEDIRDAITLTDKLIGLFAARIARTAVKKYQFAPDDGAVILFTSGTEATPKAVVLSSVNILANICQAQMRFSFQQSDCVLNCLPVFHCFGLTVGTLLPLCIGIRLYMYPSPLHYEKIMQLVYQLDVSCFISTDTFFNGYARYADAASLRSLRIVVAGGEKLRSSTRELYAQQFGIRMIEGYGATEAAPVISCNNRVWNKPGTVGKLLSNINYKLKKIAGFDSGKKLLISGPNIMKGYIYAHSPGVLKPVSSYYDTGDIVNIDDEGFISLVGRAKRFIKRGGEMVSLAQIEVVASSLYPADLHAASAIPSTKGEDIVLLTTNTTLSKKDIIQSITQQKLTRQLVPKQVIYTKEMPLLASGKLNYPRITELVQQLLHK